MGVLRRPDAAVGRARQGLRQGRLGQAGDDPGTLGEESTVRVAGELAEVDQGEFAVRFETPPRGPIEIRATDTAGNVTKLDAALNIIPREPPTAVRSVHVTFWAWKHHRAEIMNLVNTGKVTALELDLKDESGIVGFDSDVPLAEKMGAEHAVMNLEEAVNVLHSKGVRVIGRLVAFRDPIHSAWAWENGKRKQVVQTPGGDPYSGYGGFTNFANPAVRDYNIDIAKAGVAAGVDEILYDYVRRPDGPIEAMRFPGLGDAPVDRSIASFVRETREQLPTETFLGASVFGVAASRPDDIGQNIPMMARELDYISAMVYPSHWTPGEYNVPNPNAQPYDIVLASSRTSRSRCTEPARGSSRAAGLLARLRVRLRRGSGADRRRGAARHRGVHPLEPARTVHGRGARRAPAARADRGLGERLVNEPLEVLNQVLARSEQAPVRHHSRVEALLHRLDEGHVLGGHLGAERHDLARFGVRDVLAEEVIADALDLVRADGDRRVEREVRRPGRR